MDVLCAKKRKLQQECEDINYPIIKQNANQTLNVFWLDVNQDLTLPGCVLILGKVFYNSWESVCVRVNGIKRELYTTIDSWTSALAVLETLQSQGKIRDFRYKIIDTNLIKDGKTVKITCYKVTYLSLYEGINKYFVTSSVISYQENLLELFIIKLKLKGPCWVKIENYVNVHQFLSNCKRELVLDSIKSISRLDNNAAGCISVLFLRLETHESEIKKISWVVYSQVDPSVNIELPNEGEIKEILYPGTFKTEKELINYFLMKMYVIDADIIVGYNIYESFNTLIHRIKRLDVKNWSRLGKLKRSRFPSENTLKSITFGRMIYEDPNSSTNLSELIQNIRLLYVIPISLYISNLTGTTWSKALSAGNLLKCEYTLLHELHAHKYLSLPKKPSNPTSSKPKFKGGLVLEPVPGLYENILYMDYNSLYPTIILEKDLCFTGNQILPKVIKELISRRKEIQEFLVRNHDTGNAGYGAGVDCKDWELLNFKQLAIKKIANSVYGSLGCEVFRFYCPGIAEKIASVGRDILNHTVTIVQQLGLKVIYGDTDSIMIQSKSQNQAFELGKFLEARINMQYSFVNISVKEIYSRLLIIQKKNYAGINYSSTGGTLDIKGLIKGNNSDFCRKIIKNSIEILLKKDFNTMEDYINQEFSKTLNLKHKDSLIPSSSNPKNYIKLTLKTPKGPFSKKKSSKTDEIQDYKLCKDQEINPFILKIKKILKINPPESKYYYLCPKNHKVHIIQDSEIIYNCKECAGSINHEENLTESYIRNILIFRMKQKVNTVYLSQKVCSNKSCDYANTSGRGMCLRSQCNGSMVPVYSLKDFSHSVSNLNAKIRGLIQNCPIQRIYENISYFKINLKTYKSNVNYSEIFT